MTTMAAGPPALDRARRLLEPELRAAVARLDPSNQAIAAYHLGWTEADGTQRNTNGGKAIRPTMALLAAEAVGADPEAGLPAAVAVELVHNFSLIHDDLMDGDRERRHRPTVWALWGIPAAVLAGDALLVLAQEELLAAGRAGPSAAALLGRSVAELIRGQTEDLAFERRTWVELEECRRMAAGKTGALLSASARTGALLAGAGEHELAALGRYGEHVGMAFQLMDDVLGIWGDPAVTGKPVLSDLRSKKKSLPVTYVLGRSDEAAEAAEFADELARWLAQPNQPSPPGEPELYRIAQLIEDAGGRAWAIAEAEREVELAVRAVHSVPLIDGARDELIALTRFLTRREA
jgi:geranylgeranyl diphosphate synthase type I